MSLSCESEIFSYDLLFLKKRINLDLGVTALPFVLIKKNKIKKIPCRNY